MEKSGLATAVEQLDDGAAPFEAPTQLPLLPTLAPEPAGTGDRGQGLSSRAGGPGRPKGSRNKSTKEWVAFLGGRYRFPLVGLCETFNRPVEDLAEALGTNRTEAFKLQIQAMMAALPYLHQRQPQAIEIDTSGEIFLTINRAPAAGIETQRTNVRVIDAEIIVEEENDEKSTC